MLRFGDLSLRMKAQKPGTPVLIRLKIDIPILHQYITNYLLDFKDVEFF